MSTPLLEVTCLSKRFGGLLAVDAVDLSVANGALHALIGPNGAGKTTLVNLLAGALTADDGCIRLAGEDLALLPDHARARRGLIRSFQITSIFPSFTAADNVALAVQAQAGHSFRFWRPARRDARLRDPAAAMLRRVGLADRADMPAAALSHGERRQLELAMALATGPRLLLLDEPVAGMAPDESARMVDLLATLKGRLTILLIEHDMTAVFTLADRISVLVGGRVIADGAPDVIRGDPAVQRAYLGDEAATG